MSTFSFLNLRTYYRTTGEKFNLDLLREGDYCFRKVFKFRYYSGINSIPSKPFHQVYEIHMIDGVGLCESDSKYNNACLFSEKEIKRHLDWAKKNIHPFEYTLQKIERKHRRATYISWSVTIDICSRFLYQKILLTWVRYLYEFPTNVITKDVYRMTRCPEFRFMNLMDLYNLASFCYPTCTDYKTDQTLSYGGERMTLKELRKKFSKLERDEASEYILSKIFKRKMHDEPYNRPICKYRADGIHEIGFWTEEEEFKQRKAVYIKNLEEFNKKA